MNEGLKPYPQYKESGQDWLGQIPAHWYVGRLGSVFAERGETNEKREVTEVLSVLKDVGVILYSEKGRIGNNKSEDIARYKIVRQDDLVVNCMNVIIGSVGRSRYTGCLSPVYYVLKRRKPENLSRFLELVFQHKSFQRSLVRIGNGILAHRMRIPMEKLKAELFPTPPPDEQAAIVRFLDHAHAKIDRFIRAKRRLIKLLEEQKQAIIHHAVTRGLDPNVKLKPSGIPWLGDIPQHWKVRKLRTVADMIVSNVDKHSKPKEESVRLCNYTDVYKNEVISSRLNFMIATATKDEIGKFKVRIGDVIITKDSEEWDDIGVPALVAHEADDLVCGYHLAMLRPRSDILRGEFLLRALQDRFIATQMHVRAKGVTRYGLSHQGIKEILLLIPPLKEQDLICAALTCDFSTFNIVITRTERQIALMQEYRTRLTADIVTGKLDVREAAAKLPDPPADSTPAGDSAAEAEPEETEI